MIQVEAKCPSCGAVHNPILHRSIAQGALHAATADGEPAHSLSTLTYLCESCGETYWFEMPSTIA